MNFSMSLVDLLTWIPPLILIEGFFSGTEIALLSADRLELQKKQKNGSKGAAHALFLISRPERILSTTLLMTSLCVITISMLIAIFITQSYGEDSNLLAILITSPLVVLFGELIPKTIYQRNANTFAPYVAKPISVTFWTFYPITKFLSLYTTRLSRIVTPIEELLTGKKRTTRDELRSMLTYSKRETEIKSSEKRMIKRIFDFKDTEAKHALIPLVKVHAIENTSTVEDALEAFQKHRHSRMPVYSERIDNIVGVLSAKSLLTAEKFSRSIDNYYSPANYTAETQVLEDVLFEMHQQNSEMTIVVDEYGGAIGILTIEDIVEEVVGEIQDEYESENSLFKNTGEGAWLVQARMEIQHINEVLKIELPEGDYETLAGFLLQQFGRIPEPRDELHFDTSAGSYRFIIKQADKRTVRQVTIESI